MATVIFPQSDGHLHFAIPSNILINNNIMFTYMFKFHHTNFLIPNYLYSLKYAIRQ